MTYCVPIVAIVAYICYPKGLRINENVLYCISVLHNTLLISFSAWVFISMCGVLDKYGIVFKSNHYFQFEEFDKIMYYFYLSKYYEFFDTFLLYLKGREPIFLQKYHHIGAVLAWHGAYVNKMDSIWIPSFANSFIHTIMYSYYLGCLLKIKQVRFIKKYLTSMQLMQLVGTMSLCNYYYTPPNDSWENYQVMCFINFYNIGLIVLFIDFFKRNYSVRIQEAKKKENMCKIILKDAEHE